jgi:hypothetical protein
MNEIPRRKIRQSLENKGFILDQGRGDHDWYYFFHNGKKFKQVCAKISRGSHYKTYHSRLIDRMKKLLQLDSLQDTKDLLECPMDKNQYLLMLKEKGII